MALETNSNSIFFSYMGLFIRFAQWRLALLIFLIFIGTFMELLGVVTLLPLLQLSLGEDLNNPISQKVLATISNLGFSTSFASLALIISAIFIFKALVSFAQNYWTIRTIALVRHSLQSSLARGLEQARYEFYLEQKTGYLANLMTVESARFAASLRIFSRIIVSLVYSLIYIPTIIVLEMEISLIIVVVGMLAFLVARPLIRHTKALSMDVSDKTASLSSEMVQFVESFDYLKATANSRRVRQHVLKRVNDLADRQIRMGRRTAALGAIKEPLAVLSLLGYIFYNVEMLSSSMASTVVIALIMYRVLSHVLTLPLAIQRLHQLIGGVHYISNFSREIWKAHECNGSIVIDSLNDDIIFQNVSLHRKKHHILKGINLTIPYHKSVAIVGESGAGKTTIFRLLTRLIVPDEGSITIGEHNFSDLNNEAFRSRLGYVTQDPMILNDTIATNLTLRLGPNQKENNIEKMKEAARAAHCHDFIEALPQKYMTQVGERGASLSGGERQRIAIARELYKDPDILIFDEATNALDAETDKIVQASIEKLHGKRTIVVIAHRLSSVAKCDHIYVMAAGRILESGSFKNLYENRGSFFRKMWDHQVADTK
ncbi:MAG: hypothetical protein CMM32_05460 [Rhodospirillaceae bacterium]|nr:hypothetical protein [Rhodospirillaceae bacterium]